MRNATSARHGEQARQLHGARRGFATTTAVVLVGLVGFTLAALASGLTRESRRTGAEVNEAQLRQLVHTASIEARDQLRRGEIKAGELRTISLPDELVHSGAKAEIRFAGNAGALTAEVLASVEKLHRSEHLQP